MKKKFMEICRAKAALAKKELSAEDDNFLQTIAEGVEEAFKLETTERNKQLEDLAKQLGVIDPENKQTFSEIVRNMAQKVTELEAKSERKLSDSDKGKIRKALEDKKDMINAIRKKESKDTWEMQFSIKRAASALMTTSTVVTGAVASNSDNLFDEVAVEFIRYPKNFILDAISSRQVSKVPVRWGWREEKAASDGVPAATSEGSTKPLTDDAFAWHYADRKKYAGRIELTEEVEIDFEQLLLDIISMFESKVLRAYNTGVLTDILAWAPTYAGTALDGQIVNPTIMNVCGAGNLQLAAYEAAADTVCINPADYALTMNMQNVNGDPIFIPDSVVFPGMRVFVSNKITQGTILMGEGASIQEQHTGFILRQGVYGNQFIENEKTIVGELFSCMKIDSTCLAKNYWVKLDIATVKAALKKTA